MLGELEAQVMPGFYFCEQIRSMLPLKPRAFGEKYCQRTTIYQKDDTYYVVRESRLTVVDVRYEALKLSITDITGNSHAEGFGARQASGLHISK
jgi:hypothetical protein